MPPLWQDDGDPLNMAKYAEKTQVPALQSRLEIEKLLQRYGATHFGYLDVPAYAMITFESKGRRVRFKVPVPDPKSDAQGHRQIWRALVLAIKAKLESVNSGIEQFDDAFMSQLVLPDNRTMGEVAQPQITKAYATGTMPPLLLGKEG